MCCISGAVSSVLNVFMVKYLKLDYKAHRAVECELLQDVDKSVSQCIKQPMRKSHVETRYRHNHKPTHSKLTQTHKLIASNARLVL